MKTPYHYFINTKTDLVCSVEPLYVELYRSKHDFQEVIVTPKPEPVQIKRNIIVFKDNLGGICCGIYSMSLENFKQTHPNYPIVAYREVTITEGEGL